MFSTVSVRNQDRSDFTIIGLTSFQNFPWEIKFNSKTGNMQNQKEGKSSKITTTTTATTTAAATATTHGQGKKARKLLYENMNMYEERICYYYSHIHKSHKTDS